MKGVILIIFLFFFAIPVFFFVSILVKGIKGAKKDEWEGVVADKIHNTVDDDGTDKEYFTVVFKTEKGIRKIAMIESDYNGWSIGDKGKKVKDVFGVKKISK